MPITRRRRRFPRRAQRAAKTRPDSKLATIKELCSFERRLAGTDAERRAANAMAGKLRGMGRRVEIEPLYCYPQAPLAWAAHTLLLFIGSLLSISVAPAGFALVLLVVTSFYFDLNTKRHLLRRLFFRRASQNVVSRGKRPNAPARLILAAHLDTARSGLLFGKGMTRLTTRLAGWLPFPHTRILFWSGAVLLPILGARMAGIDTDGLAIVQLGPTLILLVATFLLVEWQLSTVVPGANDNASGVAVALSAAERLEADGLSDLDVWVVLTGAEESGMEGMRAFARAHRDDLEPTSTFVVAIDSVGSGDLCYVASEGMTISFDMDRRLLQLCDAIAEADREGDDRYGARPLRHGFATDALAATTANLRATTITALEPGSIAPSRYHRLDDLPGAIDQKALDRAENFVVELATALDRDVGRANSRRPAPESPAPKDAKAKRRRRRRRKRNR